MSDGSTVRSYTGVDDAYLPGGITVKREHGGTVENTLVGEKSTIGKRTVSSTRVLKRQTPARDETRSRPIYDLRVLYNATHLLLLCIIAVILLLYGPRWRSDLI